MQPHNDDQCPEEGNSDRGRNAERVAFFTAIGMAVAQVVNLANRKMRVAEPGQPCDLRATITGSGSLKAD